LYESGVLVFCVLALSGYYEPEPKPQIKGKSAGHPAAGTQVPPAKHQLMGRSVQGRAIMIQVLGRGSVV
jgi:hypothetical protein